MSSWFVVTLTHCFPQVYTHCVNPCPSTVTPTAVPEESTQTAQSKPRVLPLISLKLAPNGVVGCMTYMERQPRKLPIIPVLPASCPPSSQGRQDVFSNLGTSHSQPKVYCLLGCVALDKWFHLFWSVFSFVEWKLFCELER